MPGISTGKNQPLAEDTPQSDVNRYVAPRSKKGLFTVAYPMGLGSDEQPHWLQIQIRVRGQSTQGKRMVTLGAQTYTNTAERRIDPKDTTKNTAGIAAVSVANNKMVSLLAPIGVFAAVAAGAVVGAAASEISGDNSLYTLDTIIGLGLQEPPKASYQTTWEGVDIGSTLSGGKIGAGLAVGLAGEAMKNKIDVGKEGTGGVTNEGARAAIEKGLGKVKNPYKEQIFKNVEFRTFSFEYTFLPNSVQEANKISDMIMKLKSNMLPETAENAFYLIYPSEFSLKYMYKDAKNDHVHQFGDCVLIDMGVKYGTNDFVTFKNSNGIPAEIVVSLTFREIVPINANRVVSESL